LLCNMERTSNWLPKATNEMGTLITANITIRPAMILFTDSSSLYKKNGKTKKSTLIKRPITIPMR